MSVQEELAVPSLKRCAVAVAVGLASGVVFVLIPYSLAWLYAVVLHDRAVLPLTSVSGFNSSLTILFPIVQGFALALALGPPPRPMGHTIGLVTTLMLLEIAAAAIIIHEGAICLLIVSPLIFAMMLGGAIFGRLLARRNPGRMLRVSFAPLIVLAVFAEAAGPKPDFASVVTDFVTINAPPEMVWRYVVSYPENGAAPEYWLWRIGLPEPIQSVAEAPRVGARRVCRFSGGAAFEEEITELTPHEVMTFAVTKQPDDPEVLGHFRFDQGQIRLTRNANGSTTITATSWYRLFVRPAAYFDHWTADITRHVHFRVLNHIKALAERDYRNEPQSH